jgi:signal transduction histidine kinase/ligand-binding sensor domain-containing protein
MHYGNAAGLASNEVLAVVQDSTGYIWIGTNNGLQRFDGVRYETFRSRENDATSLPHNAVIQILFDKKGNMWVLTADGKVGIFDTRSFKYKEMPVRVKDQSFLQRGKKVICDQEGNVMFLFAGGGLTTWNPNKQEFSADYNFIPGAENLDVYEVVQQPGTRRYWISTPRGTHIYNLATHVASYPGRNIEKEKFLDDLGTVRLPGNFLFDSHGRIWFDTWIAGTDMIYAYDLNQHKILLENYNLSGLLKNYFELSGFIEQKNGTIWVKGMPVFAKFLEKEKEFQLVYNGYESEQSISYSRVNNLFEDNQTNIWIATNTNGLYQFNPAAQFFTNVRQINRRTKTPGDGSMMAFIQSRDKTLLAGAWNDGLYRYDSNYNMRPLNIRGFDEVNAPYAWGMCYSRDSDVIWIGTQPGVFKVDEVKRTSTYYNPAIMQNRTVRQVAEDVYGNLWMGTQSLGLFKWTASKGNIKFEDGVNAYSQIPVTQIQKIITDKRGYVWVGTSGYGLFVIDPSNDRVILHLGMNEPASRKLSWNQVPAIVQYDDSTMVIAANAVYLFNTRHQTITNVINMPESMPGLISAIEKDKSGYLWISSSNGIFRLNPKNKRFVHFDRADGIANDLFLIGASYTLPDGKIVFGADNQFVVFDPMQVRLNNPAPDVVITGFELMNRSLLVDSLMKRDRIELNPKDNAVTIDFSALNYEGAYLIRYKLDGLDKDWIKADKDYHAVYSYLPPGHYTFMVRGEDADGNVSRNITKLAIKVDPPFWKTWWFLSLIVFAAIAAFYWLDKLRMQRVRATERIRTRIATSLTEDMTNSLSSINISSELAKTKVDTDRERTKEYIAQISETSNRMVQAMYDMVWSIDPKNDTMTDTIERMKNFAVEVESLHNVDILFEIDEAATKLNLDMAHRYELLSVFKEAISNSARHSVARHIRVCLRLKNSKFFLLIEDDGNGFDVSKAGLGRGMNDMKRRAADIKASLHIESEQNTGTIVKLEMPV